MTGQQPWSSPTRRPPPEINGAPLPLDSVIGRMILAEQTKTVIKLDHVIHELRVLPDRIAHSMSAPRERRGLLKQYTDFLQAILWIMLLLAALLLWWNEPDLFRRVVMKLIVLP